MSVFDHMAWAKRQKTGSVGRKAVLMALAERTGDRPTCWPSQVLIAEETEQSVRTVRRHLGDLEEQGLIRSSRTYQTEDGAPISRGRARNRYELLIDQPVRMSGEKAADQADKSDRPSGQTGTTKRTRVAAELPVLEEPSLEHPPNPPSGSSPGALFEAPPAESDLTAMFEEFWMIYPRRVAKAEARRAWKTAIRSAPVDEIMEGARRYTAETEGRDPAHIAHPATWLRGQRWEDEPGSNATRPRNGASGRVTVSRVQREGRIEA